MKQALLLLAALMLCVQARAIELSLEENRAERGGVGFVDMSRLFAASPDAQREKANFEELVRQAEERVNLRKAELLKLRQQIDSLRAQRETLAKTYTEPVVPPAASTAAAVAAPAAPLALPGMASPLIARSSAPALSAAAAAGLAVSSSAATVAFSTNAAAVAFSTRAAAAPAVAAAPPAPPVLISTGPSLGQQLLEIDGHINSLQAEALRKEAELASEHDDADRGLLDVESRKTDQVLVRIYRAISEVSRAEGVSVVVDKTHILYGRQAVDLTDKVLKRLRENQQP